MASTRIQGQSLTPAYGGTMFYSHYSRRNLGIYLYYNVLPERLPRLQPYNGVYIDVSSGNWEGNLMGIL